MQRDPKLFAWTYGRCSQHAGCDLMTADGGGVGALPNAVHLWPLPLPM
eukprot:SAG31_NODE_29735_length_390_cov_1.731959_1_plen_47_part_10